MTPNLIKIIKLCAIIFTVYIGIAFGIMQIKAPRANYSDSTFINMLNNIETWSRQSQRITGSLQVEQTRQEIITEIESIGITPIHHSNPLTREQAFTSQARLSKSDTYPLPGRYSRFWRLPEEFYVNNIFVQLNSYVSDRAIMFVTHYDSWPNSPGAADAMLPVAAMIEALRSQANNNNLQNNIYFLFTDGEEFAALGALAFIHDHPHLRDSIDMIINLEARGNAGGLTIFETSHYS
jgi:acetylornithine deacetylase/succinyl-diaminopimelate desuccinylase-like protein